MRDQVTGCHDYRMKVHVWLSELLCEGMATMTTIFVRVYLPRQLCGCGHHDYYVRVWIPRLLCEYMATMTTM